MFAWEKNEVRKIYFHQQKNIITFFPKFSRKSQGPKNRERDLLCIRLIIQAFLFFERRHMRSSGHVEIEKCVETATKKFDTSKSRPQVDIWEYWQTKRAINKMVYKQECRQTGMSTNKKVDKQEGRQAQSSTPKSLTTYL